MKKLILLVMLVFCGCTNDDWSKIFSSEADKQVAYIVKQKAEEGYYNGIKAKSEDAGILKTGAERISEKLGPPEKPITNEQFPQTLQASRQSGQENIFAKYGEYALFGGGGIISLILSYYGLGWFKNIFTGDKVKDALILGVQKIKDMFPKQKETINQIMQETSRNVSVKFDKAVEKAKKKKG